jgi:hypothetical protein
MMCCRFRRLDEGPARQILVPNKASTPGVSPMASAPQNVTRKAPGPIGTPPDHAARAPRTAMKSNDGIQRKQSVRRWVPALG